MIYKLIDGFYITGVTPYRRQGYTEGVFIWLTDTTLVNGFL